MHGGDGAGRAPAGAGPASLAQGRIDPGGAQPASRLLESRGMIIANVDTLAASAAERRIDDANGGVKSDLIPRYDRDCLGRSAGALGNGIGNIFGPADTAGDKDALDGRLDRTEFGMALHEETISAARHFQDILGKLYGGGYQLVIRDNPV